MDLTRAGWRQRLTGSMKHRIYGAPGTHHCMTVRKGTAVARCHPLNYDSTYSPEARSKAAVSTISSPDARTAAKSSRPCPQPITWLPRCHTSSSILLTQSFSCRSRWSGIVVRYHQAVDQSSLVTFDAILCSQHHDADICRDGCQHHLPCQ